MGGGGERTGEDYSSGAEETIFEPNTKIEPKHNLIWVQEAVWALFSGMKTEMTIVAEKV